MRPAVSLIIMEENLDGEVSATQGKEPITLGETETVSIWGSLDWVDVQGLQSKANRELEICLDQA